MRGSQPQNEPSAVFFYADRNWIYALSTDMSTRGAVGAIHGDDVVTDDGADTSGDSADTSGEEAGTSGDEAGTVVTPLLVVPRVDLNELLGQFVGLYSGMRQRDHSWYTAMGVTIGGSELAALMGLNPYSSAFDVIMDKLTTLAGGESWGGGGEACWWGTLFEDIIGAYVEADLGAPIQGDDICIREHPGHRNSPDGYIVARFYRGTGGARHLWTTDMSPRIPTVERILLLEFKCPMSRKPLGTVPRQYKPQVWSGLAVSPVAHLGLYVDAVFRKCGVADLGDSPDYDTGYHRFDHGRWELPVAWGLIGVYAPRLDAPRRVRLGWRGDEWAAGDPPADAADADAAQAAWQIHSTYFEMPLRGAADPEVADLGDMEPAQFNRALGLINRGRFPVTRGAACFADGRGAALHSWDDVCGSIEALRRSAPDDHWLLGVLPWKLFEVNYIPVDRRPGFMAEVAPLIAEMHRTVAAARETADPAAYVARVMGRPPPREGRSAILDESDVQDLFDAIAADDDATAAGGADDATAKNDAPQCPVR